MKIRQGFVSNSSSTSFCIYGLLVSEDERKLAEEKAEELGLFTHYTQDGYGIYIGREFSTIKDDETGKEFKGKTQELINQLPIEDKGCTTITEGWYDG